MEQNLEIVEELAAEFTAERLTAPSAAEFAAHFQAHPPAAIPAPIPAWLWPNLLSLDAPLVAVLWQLLFARCFRVSLGLPAAAVLVFTVWLVYSADRVFDAWRGVANAPRHQFYKQHWRSLAPVWIVVILTTAWLACRSLPSTDFERGVILLGCVGIYLLLVHCLFARESFREFFNEFRAKEILVGALFALGASLVAWGNMKTPADAAAVLLFAVLCWINCAAIETWEATFPLKGRANNRSHLRFIAVCVGLLAGALFFIHRPVLGGAEAASACAFLLLWQARGRFSRNALRVLADAALLSPLLFLPLVGSV